MRRRLSLLLALLVISGAVATPTALAQVTDPFGAGTPTPAPTAVPSTQGDTSDSVLFIIAGGVLVVFIGIGFFITRDARRNLTAEDRAAVERGDDGRLEEDREQPLVDPRKKAQRRKKTKAQRQARKANRPR